MLYQNENPRSSINIDAKERPMYICAKGDAENDQALLREKLIDYTNHLQLCSIKDYIQNSVGKIFSLRPSHFKNFVNDQNIEVLLKKNPNLKKDFKKITGEERDKVRVKGQELYDTEDHKDYLNHFLQEISIGTYNDNGLNNEEFRDNFQTPGGRYDVCGNPFIFGFQTIIKNDKHIDHGYRYGVILLSDHMIKTLRAIVPDKADTVLRYLSKLWQYMNHDWYHNFMMFEDTKLNKSRIINGYTSGYELHSAKTHADLLKEMMNHNPTLRAELISDMKYYVSMINNIDGFGKSEKRYFLLIYFYAFRRIFDKSDSEFNSIKKELQDKYNIDITNIFSGTDNNSETEFTDHIHNGGSVFLGDGKYQDYREIMRF